MKKFFVLCLMAFVMCSCGSITTITETYYGKVTTFTPQGEILNTWDNAVIKEETTEVNSMYGTTSQTNSNVIKAFGLNFFDEDTGKFVIISNTIPYIIEYDVTTSVENDNINNSPKKTEFDLKKDELELKHRKCSEELNENKKIMRTLDKKSEEYLLKKEQNNNLRKQMKELENAYIELTGTYMYGYVD